MIAYLDSSAFVKLVKEEAESTQLLHELRDWPDVASSRLLSVEVLRAARAAGRAELDRAATLLANVALLPLTDARLDDAVEVDPVTVRSLEAIHLATALSLEDDLGVLFTYDRRMLDGAAAAGIETLAPA